MCQGIDVIRLQEIVASLRAQIRDLEVDLTICQPRQPTESEARPQSIRNKLTRQQAATLATRLGVSERTIWRQAKAGKLSADDIEE